MQTEPASLLDVGVKRQNNDLTLIGRLPDEVLETVFVHLRDACTLDNIKGPHTPDWVRITWVSHWFRTICLAYPLLWNYITDYHTKWLLAFVERSMPSPLDVHIYIYHHKGEALEWLSQNVFRIRTLLLNGVADRMHDVILPRLNAPAPVLRTLSLQAWLMFHYDTGVVMGRMNDIFARQTPCLRSLEVWNTIHLTPTYFMLSSSLESLSISGDYLAVDIAGLLRAVPQLRSLAVLGRNLKESTPTTVSTVTMPCLESVALEMQYAEVAHLLHILRLPSICSASISLLAYDFIAESNTATIGVLSTLLRRSSEIVSPFQSLRLYSFASNMGYTGEGILLWHSLYAGTERAQPSYHPKPPVQIEFRQHARPRPVVPVHTLLSFYKHICASLPLADEGTLTLEIDYALTPHEWTDVLRPLARIERLKLFGNHLSSVVDALTLSPFILPLLSRVAISALMRAVKTPPFLRELIGAAKARASEQTRLHIAFEDCDRYNPTPYEELRKHAIVTWDNLSFFEDSMLDEEPWLDLIS